jgi:hypothetical protein
VDETPWHLYPFVDTAYVAEYGRWIESRVQHYLMLGDAEALEVWCELLERYNRAVVSYQSYRSQLDCDREVGE